ncbi:MAG: hypothetical protein ACREJX_19200, partial [Polyangiaceae bacterium]
MKHFACLLIASILISICGCWNNAGSDPHPLPSPPPSSSSSPPASSGCPDKTEIQTAHSGDLCT